MATFFPFDPVAAPHKTKRFWIFVALGLVPVLSAPLVQRLLGLPLFSLRVTLESGLITFATWVVAGWIGFRFGRTGWLGIAIAMLVFAIFARFYS
jgi:hypothetical protein